MIESAFISETLARGLTSRFFSEMLDLGNRINHKLISHKPKITDRNSHRKYIKEVKKNLEGGLLIDYEGGSKSQPYYALDLISAHKEREFNTWKEKCLSGSTMLFSHTPRYFDWVPAPYTLGEHAIYRLFCRVRPPSDQKNINPRYIIKQLEQLPLWSNFWMKQNYLKENPNFGFSPILPAPNGLFLGEVTPSKLFFEIRTFIGDHQLTENQYDAKSELLKIGHPYLKSPMSFATPIMASGIDYIFAIQTALCHELISSIKFDAIKTELFNSIEDDALRSSIKNKFEKELLENREIFSFELVQKLKKDIRGCLRDWKIGIYKHMSENPNQSLSYQKINSK